nr:UDP-N-acetylmuramate dehydrogenase [Prevotella sp.]
MRDISNFSLLNHNTFGIDAKCKRFLEFDTVEELQQIVSSLTTEDNPLLLLGGGSNLLLTGDYAGTVIHSSIKGIERMTDESLMVRCGSGETWDDVVAYCVDNNLYGAENLSIIPGEVGACAVQNIGAYGAEAKDLIFEVEAVEISTGDIVKFGNKDCEYSYRQSKFKHEWRDKYIITYVTFRMNSTFTPHLDYGNIRSKLAEMTGADSDKLDGKVTARLVREAIIGIRNEKLPDPKVEGNAGSFFMNPIIDENLFRTLADKFPDLHYYKIEGTPTRYKIPAGWMIDQCGWKGKTLGKVGVHGKQALVLVNRGGAKGEDVVNLCNAIRNDVKNKFGIDIYPEVNIK